MIVQGFVHQGAWFVRLGRLALRRDPSRGLHSGSLETEHAKFFYWRFWTLHWFKA